VGQSVLERVLEVWEEADLVEKLCGLKLHEAAAKIPVGKLTDASEEGIRYILADDRGGLEESLRLGRKPIDPGGEDALDSDRHLRSRDGPRQAIGPALAHEGVGLYQGPDALFQEERVPLGPFDQKLSELLQIHALPEEGVEKLFGALEWQRINP
jgi:hypothetical protein